MQNKGKLTIMKYFRACVGSFLVSYKKKLSHIIAHVWPGRGPNYLPNLSADRNKSSLYFILEGRQKLNPILLASLVMSQLSSIMATYLHNRNKVLLHNISSLYFIPR